MALRLICPVPMHIPMDKDIVSSGSSLRTILGGIHFTVGDYKIQKER